MRKSLSALRASGGSKRKTAREQDRIDGLEAELDEMLFTLQCRYQLIEKSRALLKEREVAGSDPAVSGSGFSLLALGEGEDFEFVVEQTHDDFDLLEFVAQACEVFPEKAEPAARLRKGRIMDAFLIREVCREMLAANEPIRVATVGRLLKERFGGPNAQSIRDQPNRLKRLVEFYAKRQSERHRSSARGRRFDKDLLIEIDDLTVRAQLRQVIAERDQFEAELRALRQAFKRLSPIDALTPERCYGPIRHETETMPGTLTSPSTGTAPTFTDDERKAVARFLNERFLFEEGLRIEEGVGLLNDDTSRLLADFAFVTALRKAAG